MSFKFFTTYGFCLTLNSLVFSTEVGDGHLIRISSKRSWQDMGYTRKHFRQQVWKGLVEKQQSL